MLFHIQTCDLFLSGNTKSDGVFDHLEDNCHSNSNPCDGDSHTNKLNTEAMETTACEKTFPLGTCTVGEKTDSKSSESTVKTVNANSTNRVINFENFINKFNTKYYNESGEDSDDSCRCRRYGITACCCLLYTSINSTAALKELSDVCVTSANAVKIVKALPNKNIFFIPDRNLAHFIAEQVPEKNFIYNEGFCIVHEFMDPEEVKAAKEAHPDALVLAHPECPQAVLKQADYIGSTSGIIKYAQERRV